jgi:hypothetical protein
MRRALRLLSDIPAPQLFPAGALDSYKAACNGSQQGG